MKMNWKGNWTHLAYVVAAVFSLGTVYMFYSGPGNTTKLTFRKGAGMLELPHRGIGDYDVWPPFEVPASEQQQQNWFKNKCLPSAEYLSIATLGAVLRHWAESTNTECRHLLVTFNTLYAISTRNASLTLPVLFQAKVKAWLGNNQALFEAVYHQEIIHVVNRFTREHTIFNPLRDKRPVLPPDQPEPDYFDNIVKETGKTCDFCNFKSYTAEHTFHRVENEHAFSSSNTFKMDTLHALLAMKQHDPLHWTAPAFMGLMNLTNQWFAKAHRAFPAARFPFMIWDVLPKCGASQVHPHLHGFLDPDRYHGVVESWRRGAQDYYGLTGSNFYTDMVRLSASLGLVAKHKSAVAFASLVPRKDHEVVVMAPRADKDFFEMLFFVLRAFVDDLNKYCYSMGLAYPALDGLEGTIPAYARIITRGVVTDVRADMSSLELFGATNVNVDPFQVTQLVRDSIKKRSPVF